MKTESKAIKRGIVEFLGETRQHLKSIGVEVIGTDRGAPQFAIDHALAELGACVFVVGFYPSAKSRASRDVDCLTTIIVAVEETPATYRLPGTPGADGDIDEIAEYVAGALNLQKIAIRPNCHIIPVYTKTTPANPTGAKPEDKLAVYVHFEAQTVIPHRDD